jgi:ABC-type enterochelin transport system substrate-binding protein
MKKTVLVVLCIGLLVLVSCSKKSEEAATSEEATSQEPTRVTVQHILISFGGAIPSKPELTRTLPEAETLAKEILERAKKGEDFDALVKEYTDDSHPGIYSMHNIDVTPDESIKEYSRAGMVKAFGDVSFSLAVGDIGMTEYNVETSPYGWHIIKRLK